MRKVSKFKLLRLDGPARIASICALLGVAGLSPGAEMSAEQSARVSPEAPLDQSPEPTSGEASDIRDRWGVEIVAVRLSAAGQMLDFRYRVIDPDKAAPILDPKVKPYLLDQKSGLRLAVPVAPIVGSLRQTVRSGKPMAERTYCVLFGNPGSFVARGDEVTVVAGELRAEGLIVQ